MTGVIYAKSPLGGPAQVLEYLSRYTHRTAISNERIRSINTEEVAFTVRAENKEGSKGEKAGKGGKRLVRIAGVEFVRRFLLHVLPSGIKRIRHYGGAGPQLQSGQAQCCPTSLGYANEQPTGLGVSPRVHGARGPSGCGCMSVLQGGALASHSGVAGANSLACARPTCGTPEPGATMSSVLNTVWDLGTRG